MTKKLILAALFPLAVSLASLADAQTITDLGAYSPVAINKNGVIAENSPSSGYIYNTVTKSRTLVPGLHVGDVVSLSDINNLNQVTGRSNLLGFYYAGGTPIQKGGNYSFANGLNDTGSVAGQAHNTDVGNFYYIAIVWTPTGIVKPFGNPVNGEIDSAYDVSNSGTVVGSETPLTTPFAYVYEGGAVKPIAQGTARRVSSVDISDPESAEYVVGDGPPLTGQPRQAFVYDGVKTSFLPLLSGTQSRGLGVNSHGHAVGYILGAGNTTVAALWFKNSSGVWTGLNLNTLLPKNSGWDLTSASGINENDQIVGVGSLAGVSHGFMLNLAATISVSDLEASYVPSLRPRLNSKGGSYAIESPKITPVHVHILISDPTGPVQGAQVEVSLLGSPRVGGHYHSGNPTHGWVALTDTALQDSAGNKLTTAVSAAYKEPGGSRATTGTTASTAPNSNPLKLVLTGADGMTDFWYAPPEVSGTDTLTFKVTNLDPPQTPRPTEQKVDIRTTGFVNLEAAMTSASIVFVGKTSGHPNSHWSTAASATTISSICSLYQSKQSTDSKLQAAIAALSKVSYTPIGKPAIVYQWTDPSLPKNGSILTNAQLKLPINPRAPEPLFLNDASLESGGLNDVSGDYAASHGGHRDGKQFDIKTIHLSGIFPVAATGYDPGLNPAITATTAMGDINLETGTGVYADLPATDRVAWDKLVEAIHYRRLQILYEVLYLYHAKFVNEPDGPPHFHVNLPN